MVVWRMQRLFSPMPLTMAHSYSKKMRESGDNQIKKKGGFHGVVHRAAEEGGDVDDGWVGDQKIRVSANVTLALWCSSWEGGKKE